MKIFLWAILLLGASPWMMGADSPDPATAGPTLEQFTLKDGRIMAGSYDPVTKQLTMVNRRTGKPLGMTTLSSGMIASRKPLVITPPVEPSKALPGCQGEWIDSYDDAVAAAQTSGRPILIDFTGSDWCGWCIKLHQEVFDTPEFKEWASKNAVLMIADFPRQKQLSAAVTKQNSELAAKYEIQGYPTIVVIDASGKKLAESGYKAGGPKAWIDDLASNAHLPH